MNKDNDMSIEEKTDQLIIDLIHSVAACHDCGFEAEQIGTSTAKILAVKETDPGEYVRFYPRIVGSGMRNLKKIQNIYSRASRLRGCEGKILIDAPSNPNPPKRARFQANKDWGLSIAVPLAKSVFECAANGISVTGKDVASSVIVLEVQCPPKDKEFVEEVAGLFDSIGKANGKQVMMVVAK